MKVIQQSDRQSGRTGNGSRRGLRLAGAALAALAGCAVALPAVSRSAAGRDRTEADTKGDSALLTADATPAYRVMGGLQVTIDGKPVMLASPPVEDASALLLPLEAAVQAFSGGAATIDIPTAGSRYVNVRQAGVSEESGILMRLPIESPSPVSGEAGESFAAIVGGQTRKIAEAAVWVTLPGGKPTLMFDAQTLAGLMGATVEQQAGELRIFTPRYWAERLRLPGRDISLTAGTNPLMPDLGVSPPASRILLWVRCPEQGCWVQIYALGIDNAFGAPFVREESPAPLFGRDVLGDPVQLQKDDEGATEEARPGAAGKRILAAVGFYNPGIEGGRIALKADDPAPWASYVAVISRKKPSGDSILAAIRSGEIKPGEWTVAGIRQRVAAPLLRYDILRVGKGETLDSLSERTRMPIPMLMSLNGLALGEPLTAGDPVCVLRDTDDAALARLRAAMGTGDPQSLSPPSEQQDERKKAAADAAKQGKDPLAVLNPKNDGVSVNVYDYTKIVVLPGDTLEKLASKWQTTVEHLRLDNGIAPGETIEPGRELIVPPPVRPSVTLTSLNTDPRKAPPVAGIEWVDIGKMRQVGEYRLAVYETTSNAGKPVFLSPHTPIREVRRNVSGVAGRTGKSKITWASGKQGYVATSMLADWKPTPPAGVALPGVMESPHNIPAAPPANYPLEDRIRLEATRWQGIPRYQMGGSNLQGALDCSHFVEAVFRRVSAPCPEPPVHEMEDYGAIVHWKPGIAEEAGRLRLFPGPVPSFAALRPGDRVIFQENPSSTRQGNHHTGIYIGQYGRIANAVIHCNASRGTVTIDDLQGHYLWSIYRYTVRGSQRRQPNAWASAISPEGQETGGIRLAAGWTGGRP